MTRKEIAEEALNNRRMLTDPFKHDEWIESLSFRIKEYAEEKIREAYKQGEYMNDWEMRDLPEKLKPKTLNEILEL